MAKDRNIPKKTRSRPYEPWSGDCERFGNHRRRMAAEHEVIPPRVLYKRKKTKKVVLIATPTHNPKPRWWMRKNEYVWGRYERVRDANKALTALKKKKGWWYSYYSFRIEDRR